MNTIDWWNQSTIKGAQNQSIESIKNSRGRYPSIDQAEKKSLRRLWKGNQSGLEEGSEWRENKEGGFLAYTTAS